MSHESLPLHRRVRRKLGVVRRRMLGSPADRRAKERASAQRSLVTASDRARDDEQRYWSDVAKGLSSSATNDVPDSDDLAALVEHVGLFDALWYASANGVPSDEAWDHYRTIGIAAGASPSPLLDPHVDDLSALFRDRLRSERIDDLPLHPALDRDMLVAWLGPQSGFVQRAAALITSPERHSLIERAPRRADELPRNEDDLRFEWLVNRAFDHPATFRLIRIVGNDLPPRHRDGQSEANLRFILEHEPSFPDCAKLFLLNRIIDPQVQQRIEAVLREHDADYEVLAFDASEYASRGWRVRDFEAPGLVYGRRGARQPPVRRHRIVDHTYHDKNLYVMHNNGARNHAINRGRVDARWILPFDGNCFLTEGAFHALRDAIIRAPHLPYHVVPMARVNDNAQLLNGAAQPPADEEPQIAFRDDSNQRFDPDQRYGRRPKVELLVRLGVSGPWDNWQNEEWENDWPDMAADVGRAGVAGWVARLASGRPSLEIDDHERMVSRMQSIRTALGHVDESQWHHPLSHHAPWPHLRGGRAQQALRRAGAARASSGPPGPLIDEQSDQSWDEARTRCWNAWHEGTAGSLGAAAADVIRDVSRRGTVRRPDLAAMWVAWELRWLLVDPSQRDPFTGELDVQLQDHAAAVLSAAGSLRGMGPRSLRSEAALLLAAIVADDRPEALERSRRLAARRHDRLVLLNRPIEDDELGLWLLVQQTVHALGLKLETTPGIADRMLCQERDQAARGARGDHLARVAQTQI